MAQVSDVNVASERVGSRLVCPRGNANIIADICADCDGNYDWRGCGAGLVCGTDNCGKYHLIGATTGINHGSDCCERKFDKHVLWAEFDVVLDC